MSFTSIPERFFSWADRTPDRVAYASRLDGVWETTSWRDHKREVCEIAAALIALGVKAGDRVAIMGSNRPRWVQTDLAAMSVGAVSIGVYYTSAPEQIGFVLGHAEVAILFVESVEVFESIEPLLSGLPTLKHVVAMRDDERRPGLRSWSGFIAHGIDIDESAVEERLYSVQSGHLASLSYTSGTTGAPKAVMLTHGNLVAAAEIGIQAIKQDGERNIVLSYLPLAHVAERGMSVLGPAVAGYTTYFCDSLERLPEYLREVRPTIFLGVPRVWEKMREGILARVSEAGGLRQRLFDWVVEDVDSEMPLRGRVTVSVADIVLFRRIRRALGLDRAHTTVSSAAPIPVHLLRFFGRLGIELRELYGLSECGGPATYVRPGEIRPGSVGRAFDEVEIALGPDSEVLVRGEHVFEGYLNDSHATAAILSKGWLHTGDLGRLDEDGFLYITGRKKEIIITAGGKNIAPRYIEDRLAEHDLINDIIVIGDGRKYLTALVTLEQGAARRFAKRHGFADEGLHENDRVFEELQRHFDRINERLSRVERIKRFEVLPDSFSEATGELTPTRKLRRTVIAEKYASVINRMYSDKPDPREPPVGDPATANQASDA